MRGGNKCKAKEWKSFIVYTYKLIYLYNIKKTILSVFVIFIFFES